MKLSDNLVRYGLPGLLAATLSFWPVRSHADCVPASASRPKSTGNAKRIDISQADIRGNNYKASALLQQMYETYNRLKSFSCEMQNESTSPTWTSEGKRGNYEMTYTTQYVIQKPNRLVYTQINGHGAVNQVTSDGGSLYVTSLGPQALPSRYFKIPMGMQNSEANPISAVYYLRGQGPMPRTLRLVPEAIFGMGVYNPLDDLWRLGGPVELNGEMVDVVVADFVYPTPVPSPAANIGTFQQPSSTEVIRTLYIARSDHLLRQVSQSDINSDGSKSVVTETYRNVKTDPQFRDGQFTFKPAAGAALVANENDLYPPAAMATAALPAVKVGDIPPPFAISDLAGRAVSLSEYKGKVVLLDFRATWCLPCRREIPAIVAANKKYHGQGLEVIGFGVEQDGKKVADFARDNAMPWPEVLNYPEAHHDIANNGYVPDGMGIPWAVLIGRDGKVAAVGLRDSKSLDAAISQALGVSAP